jgi:PAS domain S-box-containing protein
MTVFLENIPDPAWMKDEQGRFVAVNTALSRICRKPKDQLLGQTLSDIHLPIEKQLLEQERQVRNSETPLRFESCLSFVRVKPSGSRSSDHPSRRGEEQTPRGSVGIARTSRDQAERDGLSTPRSASRHSGKGSDCFVVLDATNRSLIRPPSV